MVFGIIFKKRRYAGLPDRIDALFENRVFCGNGLVCGIGFGSTALLASVTRYGNTVPLPTPSLERRNGPGKSAYPGTSA